MSTRNTTHILKNSDIIARPLPSTLLKGEAIVNTADGIMFFSGVTTSTSGWTQSGPTTPTFFEVGSNLYDLKLRNQIKSYSGVTNLSGKFLSGTTSGFVLADINNIVGVDSYVTGGTFNNTTDTLTLTLSEGKPNVTITGFTDYYTTGATLIGSTAYFNRNDTLSAYTLDLSSFVPTGDTYVTGFTYNNANSFTINQSEGEPDLVATFNIVTGLTINGVLTATTANVGTSNVTTLNATGGTITTLGSTTINASTLNVTGTETVNNLTITGTGLYNTTATGSSATEIVNYGSLTAYTSANDIYVTGGTVSIPATNNTNSATIGLFYRNSLTPHTLPFQNTFTTGGTYNAGTLTLYKNDSTNVVVTGLTSTDTYVTGFTYAQASNTFTIKQNQGQPDLTAQFNSVSGLSVSNLTAGRVVYVGTAGLLTDEAGFEYNAGTNTLAVENIEAAGNVIVQGSLTVFGPSISAFTSQLYVEDPNVVFNYNPTGSTTVTSVNAGLTIQDGNGITGGSVNLDIIRMQNLTGLTVTQVPSVSEYTATTGYVNRGWITQLNDIVIRSTDITDGGSAGDINGVRVLAEFDILDGGSY